MAETETTTKDPKTNGTPTALEKTKTCRQCKRSKPLSEYAISNLTHAPLKTCKACVSKLSVRSRKDHKSAAAATGLRRCPDCKKRKPLTFEFWRYAPRTTTWMPRCNNCNSARTAKAAGHEYHPVVGGKKICNLCHENKPLVDYQIKPSGKPNGQCRICSAARIRDLVKRQKDGTWVPQHAARRAALAAVPKTGVTNVAPARISGPQPNTPIVNGRKLCLRCGQNRPLADWYMNKKGQPSPPCKFCQREQSQERAARKRGDAPAQPGVTGPVALLQTAIVQANRGPATTGLGLGKAFKAVIQKLTHRGVAIKDVKVVGGMLEVTYEITETVSL